MASIVRYSGREIAHRFFFQTYFQKKSEFTTATLWHGARILFLLKAYSEFLNVKYVCSKVKLHFKTKNTYYLFML